VLVCGVVGLLGVTAVVACGDDDDDDVAGANSAFCDDLAAYATAVGNLAALDPATATKSDYESAADDVRSKREDMVSTASELSKAKWKNLQKQTDKLRNQLQDAPDDQAVQSILDDAKPQAAKGGGA
jgi:hypothetical protein